MKPFLITTILCTSISAAGMGAENDRKQRVLESTVSPAVTIDESGNNACTSVVTRDHPLPALLTPEDSYRVWVERYLRQHGANMARREAAARFAARGRAMDHRERDSDISYGGRQRGYGNRDRRTGQEKALNQLAKRVAQIQLNDDY